MNPVAFLGALAALAPLAAQAAIPGYYCERRVDTHGSVMPHIGVCQQQNKPCNHGVFAAHPAVTTAAQPFYIPGACTAMPADVKCCLAPPPERGSIYPPGLSRDLPDGVTKEQLKCCMEYRAFGFSDSLDRTYRAELNKALKSFGITKRSEIAQFLAQVGAESGSLRWWTEMVNAADCARYDGGCTYKGRGPIQLTHRSNFREAYRWLRANNLLSASDSDNIVKYPHKVAEREYGFLTTMWFWKISKNLGQYADDSWLNFFWMSKRINGGLNGIDHRAGRWAKCTQCLGGTSPNANAYNDVDPNPGCTAIGGECKESNDCSNGFQQSGQCKGRTTKCCIPHDERSACGIIGGRCGTDGCSGGRQQGGLCPGSEPVCCVRPRSETATTTTSTSTSTDTTTDTTTVTTDVREIETAQRQASECAATGGECVASSSSCSGYAVRDVGSKGCGSGTRCCRPACSDIFGFCRAENDCPGGNQHSMKCPGASKCCIQGSNQAAQAANLRAQALAALPEDAWGPAGGSSSDSRTDNTDMLIEEASAPLREAVESSNGRLSSVGNNWRQSTFGVLKSQKNNDNFDAKIYDSTGIYAMLTSPDAKIVQEKANEHGVSQTVANWWIHKMGTVFKKAKQAAARKDVDVDAIRFLANVAGPRSVGRYYNFYTNEFDIVNDNQAASEVVAVGLDSDSISDSKAEVLKSVLRGEKFRFEDVVRTASNERGPTDDESSNTTGESASFLGIRSKARRDRIAADIAELEKDLQKIDHN